MFGGIFSRVESFLESVDSQAADSLNSPASSLDKRDHSKLKTQDEFSAQNPQDHSSSTSYFSSSHYIEPNHPAKRLIFEDSDATPNFSSVSAKTKFLAPQSHSTSNHPRQSANSFTSNETEIWDSSSTTRTTKNFEPKSATYFASPTKTSSNTTNFSSEFNVNENIEEEDWWNTSSRSQIMKQQAKTENSRVSSFSPNQKPKDADFTDSPSNNSSENIRTQVVGRKSDDNSKEGAEVVSTIQTRQTSTAPSWSDDYHKSSQVTTFDTMMVDSQSVETKERRDPNRDFGLNSEQQQTSGSSDRHMHEMRHPNAIGDVGSANEEWEEHKVEGAGSGWEEVASPPAAHPSFIPVDSALNFEATDQNDRPEEEFSHVVRDFHEHEATVLTPTELQASDVEEEHGDNNTNTNNTVPKREAVAEPVTVGMQVPPIGNHNIEQESWQTDDTTTASTTLSSLFSLLPSFSQDDDEDDDAAAEDEAQSQPFEETHQVSPLHDPPHPVSSHDSTLHPTSIPHHRVLSPTMSFSESHHPASFPASPPPNPSISFDYNTDELINQVWSNNMSATSALSESDPSGLGETPSDRLALSMPLLSSLFNNDAINPDSFPSKEALISHFQELDQSRLQNLQNIFSAMFESNLQHQKQLVKSLLESQQRNLVHYYEDRENRLMEAESSRIQNEMKENSNLILSLQSSISQLTSDYQKQDKALKSRKEELDRREAEWNKKETEMLQQLARQNSYLESRELLISQLQSTVNRNALQFERMEEVERKRSLEEAANLKAIKSQENAMDGLKSKINSLNALLESRNEQISVLERQSAAMIVQIENQKNAESLALQRQFAAKEQMEEAFEASSNIWRERNTELATQRDALQNEVEKLKLSLAEQSSNQNKSLLDLQSKYDASQESYFELEREFHDYKNRASSILNSIQAQDASKSKDSSSDNTFHNDDDGMELNLAQFIHKQGQQVGTFNSTSSSSILHSGEDEYMDSEPINIPFINESTPSSNTAINHRTGEKRSDQIQPTSSTSIGSDSSASISPLIISQLQDKITRLESDLLQSQAESAQSKSENSNLKDQIADLNVELRQSKLSYSTIEQLNESCKLKIAALQSQLAAKMKEENSLILERQNLLQSSAEKEEEYSRQITSLKKQLAARSMASTLQAELETKLRSATDQLIASQAQIDSLKEELGYTTNDIKKQNDDGSNEEESHESTNERSQSAQLSNSNNSRDFKFMTPMSKSSKSPHHRLGNSRISGRVSSISGSGNHAESLNSALSESQEGDSSHHDNSMIEDEVDVYDSSLTILPTHHRYKEETSDATNSFFTGAASGSSNHSVMHRYSQSIIKARDVLKTRSVLIGRKLNSNAAVKFVANLAPKSTLTKFIFIAYLCCLQLIVFFLLANMQMSSPTAEDDGNVTRD